MPFRDGTETFVFFGFFAFGFRASLLDRNCPLAIRYVSHFQSPELSLQSRGGPSVKARLQPVE
jgi:hypothetical protein